MTTATVTPQINDLIGWMRKNDRAARAARFLVQFFDTRELRIYEATAATTPQILHI